MRKNINIVIIEKEQQKERIMKKYKKEIQKDEYFMYEALKQAKKAAAIDEVPIGCIIVKDEIILARAYNQRNKLHSALGHAELLAINKASKKCGDWRLDGCTMYITLEPCQMCAGAIIQARIARVVVGAMNPKAGCAGSILNLLQIPQFNHQADFTHGVLKEECSLLLKDFFHSLRERKNQVIFPNER